MYISHNTLCRHRHSDHHYALLWGEPAEPTIGPETKGQGEKGANH